MQTEELIVKTEHVANLSELRKDLKYFLAKYPFNETRQICLTHRPEVTDPRQRIYDGTGSLTAATLRDGWSEFAFSEFNSEFRGTAFHDFYEKLAKLWQPGRLRIMSCQPRHCYSMHCDDSQYRFHVALETNEFAYMLYHCGKMFHIPADGHIYKMNTRERHSAMNGGDTDRIHFVFELRKFDTARPNIETVAMDSLIKTCRERKFNAIRLDVRFDVPRMRAIVQDVLRRHPPISKDDFGESYKGVGLQFDDPRNPIYDAVNWAFLGDQAGQIKIASGYKRYDQINELGKQFQFIFDALRDLPLFKGRILVARPGISMNPHWDAALALHIPVVTHENCLIHVDGQEFHLPADGHAYIINSTRLHHVSNNSPSTDRIHLVFFIDTLQISDIPDEIKNFLVEFYSTLSPEAFQEFSSATRDALTRDKNLCQVCGSGQNLIATSFEHQWPPPEHFVADDFISLCKECHLGPHGLYHQTGLFYTRAQFNDWFVARRGDHKEV